MFIKKIHGLQATNISLSDRFAIIGSEEGHGKTRARRARWRAGIKETGVRHLPNRSPHQPIGEQIARRLQPPSNRRALLQRVGATGPQTRRRNVNGSAPVVRRSAPLVNSNTQNWAPGGRWSRESGGSGRRGGGARGRRSSPSSPSPSERGQRSGQQAFRGRSGRAANRAVLSAEELDVQLERYMARSRAALDRQLDQYMAEAAL